MIGWQFMRSKYPRFCDLADIVAVILLSIFLLASCAIPVKDNSETLHYMVVGFGVVSIPAVQQSLAVQAVKSQILGVGISNQPGISLSIGYASNLITKIPEDAEDIRVELSDRPGGPVIVDVASSKLVTKYETTKYKQE